MGLARRANHERLDSLTNGDALTRAIIRRLRTNEFENVRPIERRMRLLCPFAACGASFGLHYLLVLAS